MKPFPASPLIVFEMANNHMGSLEHGLRVIREIDEARQGFDFAFGFKFQYRRLDTFIHPDYRKRSDIKYVKRFLETELSEAQFLALKKEVESRGMLAVCTPFDEASIDAVEKHGFDVLKVASCSFTDWPLLERVAKTETPLILSTAGASLTDLDSVVAFLEHRGKAFSLLHCVAVYPAPAERLQLNQIEFLRGRFPGLRVGYSAHEAPSNLDAVRIAIAKGATIFEKHVGVRAADYPLNDYSAGPEDVRKWLTAAREAFRMCGAVGERPPAQEQERATLRSLQRGVFAKTSLPKGAVLGAANTFLAIPTAENQITANDLSKYARFIVSEAVAAGAPVAYSQCERVDERERVTAIIRQVNGILKSAGLRVPGKAEIEISHHYGMDRFPEFGCTIITVVNRVYCKKLIILLPGQKHPEQFHKKKEETFHILHGKVRLGLDGVAREMSPGDVLTVEKGVRHEFEAPAGAVIEEISSTHHRDDSYYTDPEIARNDNRKTHLTHWIH